MTPMEPVDLVNTLQDLGVKVKRTSKGHYIAYAPNGVDTAMIPGTPSDPRSMKNTMADLKRIGLGLDRLKAQQERQKEAWRERARKNQDRELRRAAERAARQAAREETMSTDKRPAPSVLPMQEIVQEILHEFGEAGSTFWPIVAKVEEYVADHYFAPLPPVNPSSVRSGLNASAATSGKSFDEVAGRKIHHYYLPEFMPQREIPEPPLNEGPAPTTEEIVEVVRSGRADPPTFDSWEIKESLLDGRHVRVTIVAEMTLDNYSLFLDWMGDPDVE